MGHPSCQLEKSRKIKLIISKYKFMPLITASYNILMRESGSRKIKIVTFPKVLVR
jgi:hypothetical protein